MPEKKHTAIDNRSRRRFIGNTIKLTAIGSLLIPLQEACNNKSEKKPSGKETAKEPAAKKGPQPRGKWNYEKLILNTKTNVVHFPTKKFFNYYDRIDPKYIKELDMANWEQQVKPPVRFHRQHASVILELLALQKLVNGFSADALAGTERTLSMAFSNEFINKTGQNIHYYSFRLHDLLLRCIALNTSIPADQKWDRFRAATNNLVYHEKEAGTKKGLPPRMRWLTGSELFDVKVKYIVDNQSQYSMQLQNRVAENRFI